ncbi:MAG: amino acid ABC transporter substrate-binding protein [Rhodoferax sp.]|nr:MAG: amino acid ABC transporter substrate-binding protein [Rhodoferax sp.]
MQAIRRGCFCLALALLPLVGLAQGPVSVCADPDPPPWTYWVRDAQGNKGSTYTGFSVDVFSAVFRKLGREVRFIGDVPWSRCLKMVEAGEIDFAMDAYYSPERDKLFAFSRHYNTLTPQVFYRADSPVQVHNKADLQRYRGCGMLGASYAHYGLRSEQLDLGVNTYQGMIAKLKARRCDYFVEELEVIAGYKKLGVDHLGDKALRYKPVADAEAPAKHLIAARGSPAAALLPDIDKQLGALIASGEAVKLWKKHSGGNYTP